MSDEIVNFIVLYMLRAAAEIREVVKIKTVKRYGNRFESEEFVPCIVLYMLRAAAQVQPKCSDDIT